MRGDLEPERQSWLQEEVAEPHQGLLSQVNVSLIHELQALYDKLSKWAYGDTFSQRHVRFAFADFVTSLLQNYRRYISPLTDHDRANRMAFDSDLFCKQKKNFAENPFFYEVGRSACKKE